MAIAPEAGESTASSIATEREEAATSPTTDDVPPRVKSASERIAESFASFYTPVSAMPSPKPLFLQELVIGLKRQSSQKRNWIMFIAFVCLIISVVFFSVIGSMQDNSSALLTCIMGGVMFLFASFTVFLLGIMIYSIHNRQPAVVAMGSTRYIMRIEGNQWARFLSHFYSSDGRLTGIRGWWFSCQRGREHHRRLFERGYGHIVFGSLGFMIDELYCTTYDRHIVINVELLPVQSATEESNNTPVVDMVMRVWLCRRMYNARWGPPTPFKVDIFLASEIPAYEIPNIVRYVANR